MPDRSLERSAFAFISSSTFILTPADDCLDRSLKAILAKLVAKPAIPTAAAEARHRAEPGPGPTRKVEAVNAPQISGLSDIHSAYR